MSKKYNDYFSSPPLYSLNKWQIAVTEWKSDHFSVYDAIASNTAACPLMMAMSIAHLVITVMASIF
jgi:hypothetical protein